MLNNLKQRKSQGGFTIIEVMIVLAIAGLIMLIVFLAVPALQRNARNTQRKEDVGRVGSAANEIVSNHNGDVTSLTTARLQQAVGTMGYYVSTGVTVGTAGTNNTTTDTVVVVPNGACDAAHVNTAASPRHIAVMYTVETGGGTGDKACVDQ